MISFFELQHKCGENINNYFEKILSLKKKKILTLFERNNLDGFAAYHKNVGFTVGGWSGRAGRAAAT